MTVAFLGLHCEHPCIQGISISQLETGLETWPSWLCYGEGQWWCGELMAESRVEIARASGSHWSA